MSQIEYKNFEVPTKGVQELNRFLKIYKFSQFNLESPSILDSRFFRFMTSKINQLPLFVRLNHFIFYLDPPPDSLLTSTRQHILTKTRVATASLRSTSKVGDTTQPWKMMTQHMPFQLMPSLYMLLVQGAMHPLDRPGMTIQTRCLSLGQVVGIGSMRHWRTVPLSVMLCCRIGLFEKPSHHIVTKLIVDSCYIAYTDKQTLNQPVILGTN